MDGVVKKLRLGRKWTSINEARVVCSAVEW